MNSLFTISEHESIFCLPTEDVPVLCFLVQPVVGLLFLAFKLLILHTGLLHCYLSQSVTTPTLYGEFLSKRHLVQVKSICFYILLIFRDGWGRDFLMWFGCNLGWLCDMIWETAVCHNDVLANKIEWLAYIDSMRWNLLNKLFGESVFTI